MSNQYLIGIDIGTSGTKTLLMDQQGAVIKTAIHEYPLHTPKPLWYEQDPMDWWNAVKITIKAVLKDFPHSKDIKAIGLSGQMHGLVALDKNGEVVRPCMIWADLRTGEQCQEVYRKTGGVDGLLKYTNNLMLTGYTGGKIMWFMQNEPKLFERTVVCLNPKDFIRYKLTGELATEVSDASGTGLLDVKNRTWSYDLIDLLGIPRNVIPQCYESPEISGKLTSAVAQDLGLPQGLPVSGGGGDAVMQATGTGIIVEGVVGTTIGTGGIVSVSLDKFHHNPGGKLQFYCNNAPGKWHAMGVSTTVGGAFRWLKDMVGEPEKQVGQHTGEDVYDIVMREAMRVEAGAEGLLFLPHLLGQRCPIDDPDTRAAFVGLTLRHTKPHLFRSLLEGVVLSMRDIYDIFTTMGLKARQIRTSGGATKNQFWQQLQADIFDAEVVTMSGASHGGAYGAAIVSGVGVGIYKNVEEAVQVLKVETSVKPNTTQVKKYDRLFPVYQKLYSALKDTFKQLGGI